MATRERLDGWKAIAGHLSRDERTAMRWATERGMPIRRTPGPGRGSVYAFREELDDWLRSSAAGEATVSAPEPPEAEPPPNRAARERRGWALAGVAALLIAGASWFALEWARPLPAPVAALPPDPVARSLLLQASFDWNLRTRESLVRAIDEYSRAIGRDPGLAPAYIGLANSYLLLREYGALPEAQGYDRAEKAAKAALAIDPSAADMHRLLGFLAFWWHGDRATAGREFRRALALGPNDPLTHHWFANALSGNGEADDALREILIARDLDPTAVSVLSAVGMIDYLAGHRDQGVAILRRLEREQPGDLGIHRALADVALFEGRSDEYLQEAAETARSRGDTNRLRQIERLKPLAPKGAHVIIAAMLADAMRDAPRVESGFYRVAELQAVDGAGAAALAALRISCDRKEVASVGALGDLWLSRGLSRDQIGEACGDAPAL